MLLRSLAKVMRRRRAPKTYNAINAEDAASRLKIQKARVLVVGCNTGGDCQEFVKLGAPEVHGLDVVHEVGSEFPDRRVTYHRQSIEKTDLPSRSFDLVYSFATMEHVPDIAAAYSEMARLVKSGGVIYSMASPIWYSPYGHHMGCFQGHPWVHIVFDRDGVLSYARDHGITGERGYSIDKIVSYMLDPANFNMRRSHEYTDAIKALHGIKIVENDLLTEDRSLLDHDLGKRALALGFSPEEILAVTHRFIASGL